MYFNERENEFELENEGNENIYKFKDNSIYDIDSKKTKDIDNQINANFEIGKMKNFGNKFEDNDTFKYVDKDVYNFDIESKMNNNVNIENLNVNNFRNLEKKETVSAMEGLNRGNIFKNIYSPYRNHYYKVVAKGQKDELLLKVQALTFATIDLNLYLDIFPNDKEILSKFNSYNEELKVLKHEYETKYGPLCVDGVNYSGEFTWATNLWPWDKEGGKY